MTSRYVQAPVTGSEREVLTGFAGEDGLSYDWPDEDPDGEFHLGPEKPLATLLLEYEQECVRADAVLDAVGVRTASSARWVLVHLIEETARHLGHLDLLRELADGSVGGEPLRER